LFPEFYTKSLSGLRSGYDCLPLELILPSPFSDKRKVLFMQVLTEADRN